MYSANNHLLEIGIIRNCLQFKSIKKTARIHTFFEPFKFLENSRKFQTKIVLGNDLMFAKISSNYFNVLRRMGCKRVKKGEIKRLLLRRLRVCVCVYSPDAHKLKSHKT